MLGPAAEHGVVPQSLEIRSREIASSGAGRTEHPEHAELCPILRREASISARSAAFEVLASPVARQLFVRVQNDVGGAVYGAERYGRTLSRGFTTTVSRREAALSTRRDPSNRGSPVFGGAPFTSLRLSFATPTTAAATGRSTWSDSSARARANFDWNASNGNVVPPGLRAVFREDSVHVVREGTGIRPRRREARHIGREVVDLLGRRTVDRKPTDERLVDRLEIARIGNRDIDLVARDDVGRVLCPFVLQLDREPCGSFGRDERAEPGGDESVHGLAVDEHSHVRSILDEQVFRPIGMRTMESAGAGKPRTTSIGRASGCTSFTCHDRSSVLSNSAPQITHGNTGGLGAAMCSRPS